VPNTCSLLRILDNFLHTYFFCSAFQVTKSIFGYRTGRH